MKIQVKSLPLKEVIREIAEALNTEFFQDCDEYKLFIPPEMGEGYISGINFKSGLGLILYDCRLIADTEISFTVSDVHPAKILYCTKGLLRHSFQSDKNETHQIRKHENAIVASTKNNGHILYFKGGKRTKVSSLEIVRGEFKSKIECDLSVLSEKLQDLFKDINAAQQFYYQGFYSLELADIFKKIGKFKGEGVVRKLFLESNAYKILLQQILMYEDDMKGSSQQFILRKAEVQAVEMAVDMLTRDLNTHYTIDELAAAVGLNINKLQQGFKIMKGATINGFLKETRLEAARQLLVSSDRNISEIVYAIGLSNRGYFSRIFKKRYGLLPTEFRDKFNKFRQKKK